MDQFGYTVPKTWQQWAALGQKVANQHPGYIIGTVGDSYGHWMYLWGNKCPIEQLVGPNMVKINPTDVHCTRDGEPARSAASRAASSRTQRLHGGLREELRGANDKILLMPGPTWYAAGG